MTGCRRILLQGEELQLWERFPSDDYAGVDAARPFIGPRGRHDHVHVGLISHARCDSNTKLMLINDQYHYIVCLLGKGAPTPPYCYLKIY